MQVGNYNIENFKVQGPMLITPRTLGDERGFFTERFRVLEFQEMGLPTFIQENYSRSQARVLRGLHFQYDKPQGKLVTATRGQILDVAVDVRAGSPTFGQHISALIDGNKPQWIWIPPGFAHGFFVRSAEGADVMYKVDSLYNAAGEGAIRWNDPELKIDWSRGSQNPNLEPVLSGKDQVAPSFSDYRKSAKF